MEATYVTADDFDLLYAEREDVAVLHDLRISVPGGQLHIDHLFITDTFHVFIVESRTAEVKLVLGADRHFTSTDEGDICVIPSPIQQLKKNKYVLKRVLQEFSQSSGKVDRAPRWEGGVGLEAFTMRLSVLLAVEFPPINELGRNASIRISADAREAISKSKFNNALLAAVLKTILAPYLTARNP